MKMLSRFTKSVSKRLILDITQARNRSEVSRHVRRTSELDSIKWSRPVLAPSEPPRTDLKVAVCFAGFARTYETVANSWMSNVIKRYNADVFFAGPSVSGLTKFKDGDKELAGEKVTVAALKKVYGEHLRDAYIWDYDPSFIKSLIDVRKVQAYCKHKHAEFPERFASYCYHIHKVAELRRKFCIKEKKSYDVVIRSRPDLSIISPLQLEQLDFPDDTIYSPYSIIERETSIYHYKHRVLNYLNYAEGFAISGDTTTFSDFFHVSSENVANKMSEIHNKLPLYIEQQVPYHFETLMYHHAVNDCGLKVLDREIVNYRNIREHDKIIVSQ